MGDLTQPPALPPHENIRTPLIVVEPLPLKHPRIDHPDDDDRNVTQVDHRLHLTPEEVVHDRPTPDRRQEPAARHNPIL